MNQYESPPVRSKELSAITQPRACPYSCTSPPSLYRLPVNAIWPWYGMTDTQPSPRGAANGCAKVTVAPEIETTLRQSPAFVPFSKHREQSPLMQLDGVSLAGQILQPFAVLQSIRSSKVIRSSSNQWSSSPGRCPKPYSAATHH